MADSLTLAPRRKRRGLGAPLCLATVALLLSGTIAQRGAAQTSSDAAPLSTMSGVYTAAQAVRGEETYMGICVACHPPGTYTGAAFATAWGGRPLSELFLLISETMPKQDPGSLTPREIAQAIAYVLERNGIPAGKTELPEDAASLRKILIETPTMKKAKEPAR